LAVCVCHWCDCFFNDFSLLQIIIIMKKNIVLIVIFTFLITIDSLAQCAMCRATVGSNLSEGRGVIGTGINYGILYLLATPYLLVAGLIYMWWSTGKKELKQRLEAENRLREVIGLK
jgi:hypothetical protein